MKLYDKYFPEESRKQIEAAIGVAEKKTSGEIRLFIENQCKEDVLDRAAFVFTEMKMDETAERNGVLFYLAIESRKFAILGDAGINTKVPADFWNQIKEEMQKYLKTHEFVAGLVTGIRMAGEALEKYFPYQNGDTNELSDEIVFGDRRKKK